MSNHAEVEKYTQLIEALGTFNQSILEAREGMLKCVQVCQDVLGNDSLSMNAGNKVSEACKEYLKVVTEATELRKKLVQKRQQIIDMINEMEKMGGE